MKRYDAIIIGFGKGGKLLAAELANRNWKVAVIERSPVQVIEIIGKQKNLFSLLSVICIFPIFSIFALFCPFSVIQYTFSTL